ncbi:polyprenyl synthetase family protein [Lacibacter luteus]|uniref:Polyprenyl synthetase family protein n=1 Tax=Lacibacter luteus TaxID=2508719 RepID=A0A4Q1CEP3_9BACT|nr:polyprenyl synthetase family protein [Lacibacter luteus]RXK58058.1 polyprenyl synthetase family protein [Lacibacter luteus]
MQSFEQLLKQFEEHFNKRLFPKEPASLYDAAQHILSIGGKRVRPVAVLMGNELFDDIKPDAWQVATAIELFHNFSLIHDDIMDEAPLRRGKQTVHAIHGINTAILAGDVTLTMSYDYIGKVEGDVKSILALFNKTALEVSEGQQMDMDFEKRETVSLAEYVRMIELKTSVLLAASLKLGAMIGGASVGNTEHIYEFGRNLGIAFQVQDDYLDCFGDPAKFGKQVGGDIKANKKTFLMIHALETASAEQQQQLKALMQNNPADKVEQVLAIYKSAAVDEWAMQLKNQYFEKAMKHLEDIAVLNKRKIALQQLAQFLVQREY